MGVVRLFLIYVGKGYFARLNEVFGELVRGRWVSLSSSGNGKCSLQQCNHLFSIGWWNKFGNSIICCDQFWFCHSTEYGFQLIIIISSSVVCSSIFNDFVTLRMVTKGFQAATGTPGRPCWGRPPVFRSSGAVTVLEDTGLRWRVVTETGVHSCCCTVRLASRYVLFVSELCNSAAYLPFLVFSKMKLTV